MPAATIRQTIVAYRVGWAPYTIAMLVWLVAPALSFALYLLVAVYYLVPRGADTDLARPAAPRDRGAPPHAVA